MSGSGQPPPSGPTGPTGTSSIRGPTGSSGPFGASQMFGPTGPNNVDERIAAVAPQVDEAKRTVQAASQSQADADRSWIAHQIINIFVWVVGGVLALLTVQGMMTGQWSLVASQAAELIKTAVLPIVTLVLGYYFGQAGKG